MRSHPLTRKFSVRTRLSLWLALAIVGVVGVLAAATVAVVHTDMQTAVFALQGALIDSTADNVEDKVRLRLDAVEAASGTVNETQFADLARLQANLENRPVLKALFDNLFVADLNGNAVAALPVRAAQIPNLADRSYFQQALASDRAVVSPPLPGRASGRPVVVFAAPIRDARKRTIGVLCGVLALDRKNFLGSFGGARVGRNGHYYIVTTEGTPTVIAHRDAKRVLEAVRRGASPALDRALGGFRGTMESVDRGGSEAVHSFRSIASAPWIVAAVYPSAEAYAGINRRMIDIVLVAGAISILAMLALRWILARELEPLARLRAHMETAAGGRDDDIDDACGAADLGLLLRTHNDLRRFRARAEAAQRDVERRLRDITAHVPALISVFDADQRYEFANAHFEVALGLPPHTLIGRLISEVRDPAYVAQVAPRLAAALGGAEVTFESSAAVAGQHRIFEESYVPRHDERGAVIGVYAVTFDITERSQAKMRLAIVERRLRAVTDHLPAVVLYIDSDERYGFVNRHAQELMGSDVPILGRTLREVRGEEGYLQLRPWIVKALRGETVEFEASLRVRGVEQVFSYHYVPEIVDGVVCGFFVLTLDITEQRASELLLRRSEHRLQSITDNVPVLISYVDTAHRLAFVNQRLQDWFGMAPEAARGQPLVTVMGEAFDAAGKPFLERAFSGTRAEFETAVQHGAADRLLHTVYLPDEAPDGGVQGVFGLTSDVTAMRLAEQQLQRLARADPLTGIANRRAFDERLDEAMARCRRSHRPMGLIFLDVDRFKQINDSLGHAAGDEVLKTFAARLSESIRSTDLAARLAGDEFVVVLEGLQHRGEASLVAAKVLAATRQPMRCGGHELVVTSSLGVVYYDGTERATAADLVARADRALYRGKEAGRDTFAETSF